MPAIGSADAPTRPVGRAFDRCRFLAAAQAITARKLRQCEKSQADETAERREGFRLHDTAGNRKLLDAFLGKRRGLYWLSSINAVSKVLDRKRPSVVVT